MTGTRISDEEQYHMTLAITKYLTKIVRPVIIDCPSGPKFGSGQVFSVGTRYVLVTAGHNLAEYGIRTREISYRVGIAPDQEIDLDKVHWLVGDRVQAWSHGGQMQRGDAPPVKVPLDIGFVELLDDEVEKLGLTPVPITAISPDAMPANTYLCVVGYPVERYDRSSLATEGKVLARYIGFATGVPEQADWSPDWEPEVHQVARWPRSDTERIEAGKRVAATLPDALGISGCGMWTLVRSDDMFHPIRDLRFVGVEYAVAREREMIVGVNGNVVASQLAHFFPEAREHFEQNGFTLLEGIFNHMDDESSP